MPFTYPIVATLITAFLIIAGLRGRRVASTPHCRNCGYDLRGFPDLSHGQCSECGSQFPQAVDRTTRNRDRNLVRIGLVGFILVWLAWGASRALVSLGPDFVRIRSNDSLVRMFLDESFPERYAAAGELSRRISSGQFTSQDASPVVDRIISLTQQGRPAMEFTPFLAQADSINAINPSQFAAIAHIMIPNDMTFNFTIWPDIVSLYGPPSSFRLELHANRNVFGFGFAYFQPGFQLTAVSLQDSASKKMVPVKISKNFGYPDECGIYFDATLLPPGVYDALFTVNAQINSMNSPKVLTQWTRTEKHRVKIWPDAPLMLFSRTGPLSIDSTPPDDPSIADKLSVHIALISGQGQVRLATRLSIDGITPGLFAKVIVKASGADYCAGYLVLPPRMGGGVDTFGIVPSFPNNVHEVDVVLQPDLDDARLWGDAPVVYGNPIIFHHVPIGIDR